VPKHATSAAARAQPTELEVRRSAASQNDPAGDLARAGELIARGRSSEAMPLLQRILAAHPRQAQAREALAALQFETGPPEQALATLLEGAALDSARFAPAAAQLQASLGDDAGALSTLERLAPEQRSPAQHALHAGLALRAGSHAQAIDSYRQALRAPQPDPLWWLGLGLAHEAAAQHDAAHAAFVRALAQPALSAAQRAFVRERLAALAPNGDGGLPTLAAQH